VVRVTAQFARIMVEMSSHLLVLKEEQAHANVPD
jgi:hypothetical protein